MIEQFLGNVTEPTHWFLGTERQKLGSLFLFITASQLRDFTQEKI